MLTREQVREKYRACIHCSQVVLGELAEELGYDQEEAYRMANPFGGGMFLGDTCGCVTGALIAIGMAQGNGEPGNVEQDKRCQALVKRFQDAFAERHGSTICREIIGYDLRIPEERKEALQGGKIMETCPQLALDAIEIVSQLLQEE